MPYSNYLASGGEDSTIKIWKIDENSQEKITNQAQSILYGHQKRILQISFNKSAQSILASSSIDSTLKVWDIEQGKVVYTIGATKTEYCQSIDWNHDGSLIATSWNDKSVRVVDPRNKGFIAEYQSHQS